MDLVLRLIIIGIVLIVLFILTFIFPVTIYLLSMTPILGYLGVIVQIGTAMINSIIPVQPIIVKIIGYSVTVCHQDTNNAGYSFCTYPRATIVGDDSFALHVGDKFTLEASVYNPNWFSIDNISTSVSFDRNAIWYDYSGCSGISEEVMLLSHESTEITIPNSSCETGIANSTGGSNATATIQYQVDQKTYRINASKVFSILP